MGPVLGGIAKSILPGSLPFLMVALLLGLAMITLGRRNRAGRIARLGRTLLSVVGAMYCFFCIPAFADILTWSISTNQARVWGPTRDARIDAIVVLSGGVDTYYWQPSSALQLPAPPTALRLVEAVRVWGLLGGQPWLVVSGGQVSSRDITSHAATMRTQLLELGVPGDRILVEDASRNTREHALALRPLLARHGIRQFVVVTSEAHVRRTLSTFARERLWPSSSSAPMRSIGRQGWRRGWPSVEALDQSRATVYEMIGLMYYWWNGWLGDTAAMPSA